MPLSDSWAACPGACSDLRSIGGLPILLALLESEEPSLRWRAAEVLATCAQNNPPVQQVRRPQPCPPSICFYPPGTCPCNSSKTQRSLSGQAQR